MDGCQHPAAPSAPFRQTCRRDCSGEWQRANNGTQAKSVFMSRPVWDTANNNGVLIYLLLAEHAIEIVADRGLNHVVEPEVWQDVVANMGAAFREGNFEDGLTRALEEVSALLVRHFPLKTGDANPNELPDSPMLG